VLRLEPQVAMCEPARNDYEAALHRYRVAQIALDTVGETVDMVRVQRVVDEASWSMARARAILDGRPVPPPPESLQRRGQYGEPAVRVGDGERPTYADSDVPFRSGWSGGMGGLFFGPMFGGGIWLEEDDDRRR
jgi:hypothetical protein